MKLTEHDNEPPQLSIDVISWNFQVQDSISRICSLVTTVDWSAYIHNFNIELAQLSTDFIFISLNLKCSTQLYPLD